MRAMTRGTHSPTDPPPVFRPDRAEPRLFADPGRAAPLAEPVETDSDAPAPFAPRRPLPGSTPMLGAPDSRLAPAAPQDRGTLSHIALVGLIAAATVAALIGAGFWQLAVPQRHEIATTLPAASASASPASASPASASSGSAPAAPAAGPPPSSAAAVIPAPAAAPPLRAATSPAEAAHTPPPAIPSPAALPEHAATPAVIAAAPPPPAAKPAAPHQRVTSIIPAARHAEAREPTGGTAISGHHSSFERPAQASTTAAKPAVTRTVAEHRPQRARPPVRERSAAAHARIRQDMAMRRVAREEPARPGSRHPRMRADRPDRSLPRDHVVNSLTPPPADQMRASGQSQTRAFDALLNRLTAPGTPTATRQTATRQTATPSPQPELTPPAAGQPDPFARYHGDDPASGAAPSPQ
ncbi:MAG TPA: hypothetical protein VMF05_08555 [Stellaceae bacterium]|nr:hypothetical protein [Stellaceae bacterium]